MKDALKEVRGIERALVLRGNAIENGDPVEAIDSEDEDDTESWSGFS